MKYLLAISVTIFIFAIAIALIWLFYLTGGFIINVFGMDFTEHRYTGLISGLYGFLFWFVLGALIYLGWTIYKFVYQTIE